VLILKHTHSFPGLSEWRSRCNSASWLAFFPS
jgi:hypothetical protein